MACTRRPRSNTPLQALTLANDPAFFEIAQGFAARLLRKQQAATAMARVRAAFRQAPGREPSAASWPAWAITCWSAAKRLLRPRRKRPPRWRRPTCAAEVAPAEAAAWTMVARVLLNLDEFITRE